MAKNKKTKYETESKKMTIKEASDFWDTHNLIDFSDIKEVSFDVNIKTEKHYVLLNNDIAKKVSTLAKKLKQSQHVIVNSLLKKSLVNIL